MVTVSNVRELFALSLTDEQILPHLKRAKLDYKDISFISQDEEIEAIASKTLYYLAPLIWVASSAKAREYEETVETFKDTDKFQDYWLNRAESIVKKYDSNKDGKQDINSGGGVSWEAV